MQVCPITWLVVEAECILNAGPPSTARIPNTRVPRHF
jgi:hypothetical protein